MSALVGLDSARRAASGLDAYVRTSTRPALLTALPRLLATYVTTALPVVVVAVVIWAVNGRSTSSAFVGTDQIVFAVLNLLLAVSLSSLAAVFTTGPVFGAVWGLAVGGFVSFFGDIPLSSAQDIRLSPERIQLLAAISLIVVLCLLVLPELLVRLQGGGTDQPVRLLVAAITVASLATLVNATGLAGDLRVGRPPPSERVCSPPAPAVCVWPDHASYLPALERFAARAERASQPGLAAPRAFEEFGLKAGRDATYSFLIQDRTPNGMWVTAGGLADTMLNAALLPGYCDPATQAAAARRSFLVANLQHWLRARIFGDPGAAGRFGGGPETAEARAILTQGQDGQRAWAEGALREIRGLDCAA
jgi:hypothetical protein